MPDNMEHGRSVVPLSVISNWEKQVEEHCVRGVLSSCVYYGATRSMSPQELMQYDIVITTYQVYPHLLIYYRFTYSGNL
jgi:SWI/SNF-related matrix-associated actin-dependent regulator of chromatin subfamily A3